MHTPNTWQFFWRSKLHQFQRFACKNSDLACRYWRVFWANKVLDMNSKNSRVTKRSFCKWLFQLPLFLRTASTISYEIGHRMKKAARDNPTQNFQFFTQSRVRTIKATARHVYWTVIFWNSINRLRCCKSKNFLHFLLTNVLISFLSIRKIISWPHSSKYVQPTHTIWCDLCESDPSHQSECIWICSNRWTFEWNVRSGNKSNASSTVF